MIVRPADSKSAYGSWGEFLRSPERDPYVVKQQDAVLFGADSSSRSVTAST
jgi:hypothetical protein